MIIMVEIDGTLLECQGYERISSIKAFLMNSQPRPIAPYFTGLVSILPLR